MDTAPQRGGDGAADATVYAAQAALFDARLIARYDSAGPRYTSYPTAPQFREQLDDRDYRAALARRGCSARGLSLYLHLPFCAHVCYYCACNRIVTRNRARAAPYLARLEHELALQAEALAGARAVEQLHWGGGTPTFLGEPEMTALMGAIRRRFELRDDDEGDYSIEIDPREIRPATMATLRELGFNRVSLGVQDLAPAVQRAVNRVQSEAQTLAVVEGARRAGFRSINVDLIYGLPLQTVGSFERTLERVIAMAPDRLSLFNYAHLPSRFKAQRQIDATRLPAAAAKLAILERSVARLTASGYVYIGMDHFARPDDELARAQRERRLQRNFQGYSTHAGLDLLGFGITAIGCLGDSYWQNARTLEAYYARLDAGRLATCRGFVLDADDRLRRRVISELICHFEVSFADIEREFGIDFTDYFAQELATLVPMTDDGLLSVAQDGIRVAPRGRLLIRNICMVFDRYLAPRTPAGRYSRLI